MLPFHGSSSVWAGGEWWFWGNSEIVAICLPAFRVSDYIWQSEILLLDFYFIFYPYCWLQLSVLDFPFLCWFADLAIWPVALMLLHVRFWWSFLSTSHYDVLLIYKTERCLFFRPRWKSAKAGWSLHWVFCQFWSHFIRTGHKISAMLNQTLTIVQLWSLA